MSSSRYASLEDPAGLPLTRPPPTTVPVRKTTRTQANGAINSMVFDERVVGPKTTIESRLRTTLWILQIFGFFPLSLNPRFNKLGRIAIFVLLSIYILGLGTINGYLFILNISTTSLYVQMFDILHAQSVSCIINGLRPFINVVCMLIFWCSANRHRKFLKQLCLIDRIYSAEFGTSPNVRNLNVLTILTTLFAFGIMFAARMVEFFYMGERLGVVWLSDLSLVLVPLLTVWIVIPLIYFEVCNRLIRFWCRRLQEALRREGLAEKKPIKFYYEKFLKLTDAQYEMGNLFNPFILFSLGWSVFTLCLTIYFITQSDTHFPPAPAHIVEAPQGQEWIDIVSFNLMYGSLQVCLAALAICLICFTGTRTNEETRSVLKWLLSSLPDEDSPSDRFYVTCFMYKINTQYMWGVTVWRAFPLERSAFFTLVSLILTYAFLLLKFRQSNFPLLPANATSTLLSLGGNKSGT